MTPLQKALKEYLQKDGPSPNPAANCTLPQANLAATVLRTLGFDVQRVFVQGAHPNGQPASGKQIDADEIAALGLADVPMFYHFGLNYSTASFEAARTLLMYGKGGSQGARMVFDSTNQGIDSGFRASFEQRLLENSKVQETIESLFPTLPEAA